MWMCYAEASRATATDVTSAVERARATFSDLAFEHAHEIVYGLGRYGTDQELEEREQFYNNAVSLCEKFQAGNISCAHLVAALDAMDLEEHTEQIKEFMSREVQQNGDTERKI